MTRGPCLVDTNILLSATDAARANHMASRKFLERRPQLVAPSQVFREYLVVATRPLERNGLGLEPQTALANLETFRAIVGLLPEEKPLLRKTLELIGRTAARGARIHDVAIVAAAVVHDVAFLATYNTDDFSAFARDVTIVHPEPRRAKPTSKK